MDNLASVCQDAACPVCFEMPKREVFQCLNGHIICSECWDKLNKCPQCKLSYNAVKIRNLAPESILDKINLECMYASKGCDANLSRKDISTHNGTCSFGKTPIKLCEHIGFKCDFEMNTNQVKEALVHLKNKHDYKQIQMFPVTFTANVEAEDGTPKTTRSVWAPIFAELHGHSFLIFLKHNAQQKYISMHLLWMTGNSGLQFKGEFSIKTQNPE